jgi:hypothetical protein
MSSFNAFDGPGEFSVSHIVIVTFFDVSKLVEARPEAAEPPLLDPGLPQAAAASARMAATTTVVRDRACELVIGVLPSAG